MYLVHKCRQMTTQITLNIMFVQIILCVSELYINIFKHLDVDIFKHLDVA